MKINQFVLEIEERAAQGYSSLEISRQLELTEDQVESILRDMLERQIRIEPDIPDGNF